MILTFVIQSYSKNEILWPYMVESIRTNVPNCNIFILTDKPAGFLMEEATIIETSGRSWSEVLFRGVQRLLVLGVTKAIFTFDDLFLISCNISKIEALEEIILAKNLKCVHLAHKHLARVRYNNNIFYCKDGRYEYTLVYTYWSCEYLLQILENRKDFSPWDFENFGRFDGEVKAFVINENLFTYTNYLVRGKRVIDYDYQLDFSFKRVSLLKLMFYRSKRFLYKVWHSIHSWKH